jgi:hypothetical protein
MEQQPAPPSPASCGASLLFLLSCLLVQLLASLRASSLRASDGFILHGSSAPAPAAAPAISSGSDYSGATALLGGAALSLPGPFPQAPLFRAAPPARRLPLVDLVLVVTNPWRWSARRLDVYRAFVATQARTARSAKLIFVMGGDGQPAAQSAEDAAMFAHPDVSWVAAPGCPDLDAGTWDAWPWPAANSSTTCKVLEGAAVAVARFRFRYLARAGDDTYLRWDYFLAAVAPALPTRALLLGTFTYANLVKPHLQKQLGGGVFLPYATGAGYIMTPDVAAYLAAGYRARPPLFTAGPEDAALAYLLYPLNLHYHNSDMFQDVTYRQWGIEVCTRESILVHYVTKAMWASIDAEGVMHC